MKKKESKQYWFYIDSFVHISVKGEDILFYNPYSGRILEYSKVPGILKLIKRLQNPRNLQVLLLGESDLEDPVINEFVKQVREYFIGDFLDVKYSCGKPIQMPPIVKIQKDVKYLKADVIRSEGEKMMEYLSRLSFYINNHCSQGCNICPTAYRQFLCCTAKNDGDMELDVKFIKDLLEEAKNCSLTNIRILGGDIFTYSKLSELLSILNSFDIHKTYFLHYLNAAFYRPRLEELSGSNVTLKIPVTFPADKEKYKSALDAAASADLESIPVFIVQSEEEFDKAEELTSLFPDTNALFRAVYNGDNMDFIVDSIFIDREDVEASHTTLKDIYINGSINSLNFGELTVLSNGDIYANVNANKLGIMGKHSLYDILYIEMREGKSWRKVRKNVSPCRSCTFEKLCPPISNYNRVIGKYNLCHIRQ